MRIIVILGRVLDPRGIVINRRAGRIFINREEYILQPADRCALEAALRIKDAAGAEVVALPRIFLPDDDVPRQALATGADRAIYLTGGPLGADEAVMTRVLTAAIGKLGGTDLILTGATTMDTGQSQLGARLAESLGWPQVLNAWAVETVDGSARAVLKNGAGYVRAEVPLPAVVTVLAGALKPRYPDGVRLINIYKRVGEIAGAIETWSATDLVEADALTPVVERRGQDFPPERERGVRLTGFPEKVAQAAAEALRQHLPR